jgi:metal-responsive CopG/Arc/MetJ family transcriptional regulator
LVKLDEMSRIEGVDRSTLIRKLIRKGFEEYLKEKAAEKYIRGKITISKAAEEAGITIWEMEKFLVGRGYKSAYSVEDSYSP